MIEERIKKNIEKNMRKKHYNSKIRAIIAYGSWVRGDGDKNSDIDVLVVTERGFKIDEQDMREILCVLSEEEPIDLSIYSAVKFETLLTCGSLFLHHIKDEGEIIFERRDGGKDYLFGKLNEFKGISEDMLLYKRMYSKAINSLEGNGVNYYDLNILSILARNTLILVCYQLKKPKYGKWDTYNVCKENFDEEFQLSEQVYKELLEYRNYFNRNLDYHELPDQKRCREYEKQVGDLIDLGVKFVGIKDTVDRVFYILNDGVGRNYYTSYEVFTDFDRDIFMYTNLYLQKKYEEGIDSIREPFLELLSKKYPDDEYVRCVCDMMGELKVIKKSSTNYNIDTPDIYSEIHAREVYSIRSKMAEMLHIKEGSLIDIVMLHFTNKLFGEPRKDIIQLLEKLRQYINELQ